MPFRSQIIKKQFNLIKGKVVSTSRKATSQAVSSGNSMKSSESGATQSGYRLVMDPRTGRILGTVNGAAVQSQQNTSSTLRAPGVPNTARMQSQPAQQMVQRQAVSAAIRPNTLTGRGIRPSNSIVKNARVCWNQSLNLNNT